MLTKENLDRLYQKVYQIQRIEVSGGLVQEKFTDKYEKAGPWDLYAGKTYVYDYTNDKPQLADNSRERRCKVVSGSCQRRDVFDLLNVDWNDANWFSTQSNASILAALNAYTPQSRVNAVLGGVTRDATSGNILSAEFVSMNWEWTLQPFFDENDGNRRKVPVAHLWERDALCLLGIDSEEDRDKIAPATSCGQHKLGANLETRAYFGRSISDEFGRTIGGDQMLIGMAILLIVVYLVAMLGKRDSVHSMVALSMASVLSVLLACQSGLGFAYYAGQKDTVLRFNVYFLILGLGVDDAFVLVAEFNRVMARHPDYSWEQKFGAVVKYGGMSILVTSLTDAVAFFIGGTSSIPALSYFCFYAAFAVVFCFLFQLTFFVPCMVINAQRADANRLDCFCCFHAGSHRAKHDFHKPTGFCDNKVPGCRAEPLLPRLIDAHVKRLMTFPGKIFAMACFVGLLAASFVGIANQKADFQLEWFFPADSYVTKYFDWSDAYFSQGTRAAVYVRDPASAFTEASLQSCVLSVENYMQTSVYFDQSQMRDSWVKKFTAHRGASTTNFYAELGAYMATEPVEDVVWVDATDFSRGLAKVRVSNGVIRERFIEDGRARWDTMEAMRGGVAQLCGGKAFPFGFDFLWWEEVGYTGPEFVRNASIAAVVILFIVFAMIPSLRVNVPVILSVLATILNVVGFYHWYGEPINGVISIYTVICIGLAVDYSAHIGHMFRHSTERTGNRKAVEAVNRIGISVFNALMSTLLAVLVLSGSQSYVFTVFFKVLVLVVIFGFVNSLVVLPVLLSLFNGGACENGVMPLEDEDGERPVAGAGGQAGVDAGAEATVKVAGGAAGDAKAAGADPV
eukprot:g19696.t1